MSDHARQPTTRDSQHIVEHCDDDLSSESWHDAQSFGNPVGMFDESSAQYAQNDHFFVERPGWQQFDDSLGPPTRFSESFETSGVYSSLTGGATEVAEHHIQEQDFFDEQDDSGSAVLIQTVDHTRNTTQPYRGEDWEFMLPSSIRSQGQQEDMLDLVFADPTYSSFGPSASGASGDYDPMEISDVIDDSTSGTSFDQSASNPDIMIDSVATLMPQQDLDGMPFDPDMESIASGGSVYYEAVSKPDHNPYMASREQHRNPENSWRPSSKLLNIPQHGTLPHPPPSPTLSTVSSTPSDVQEELKCLVESCSARFHGKYRRGNWHRHMRLKHNQNEKGEILYPCQQERCHKVYKRQDARLKHYRSKHPELV